MDKYYGLITWVMIVAAFIRIPAALRRPGARPAWFATAAAVIALLSRGSFWSIQALDGLLGGANLIFLVQCWFTHFAFWFMSEAASVDTDAPPQLRRGLWIPTAWCVVFTIPFFFIPHRSPTALFFIDIHANDLAAIICGVLYIGGVIFIGLQLVWKLRDRKNKAHWIFRVGALLIVAGSALWAVAIVIQPAFSLQRHSIEWMYIGFDDLFYPGVLVMALGLIVFAIQRRVRRTRMERSIAALRSILLSNGLPPVTDATDPADIVRDLVIQIEDMKTHHDLHLAPTDEETVSRVVAWVERSFPQVPTRLGSAGWANARFS